MFHEHEEGSRKQREPFAKLKYLFQHFRKWRSDDFEEIHVLDQKVLM
jgi:hypothetical protein